MIPEKLNALLTTVLSSGARLAYSTVVMALDSRTDTDDARVLRILDKIESALDSCSADEITLSLTIRLTDDPVRIAVLGEADNEKCIIASYYCKAIHMNPAAKELH